MTGCLAVLFDLDGTLFDRDATSDVYSNTSMLPSSHLSAFHARYLWRK